MEGGTSLRYTVNTKAMVATATSNVSNVNEAIYSLPTRVEWAGRRNSSENSEMSWLTIRARAFFARLHHVVCRDAAAFRPSTPRQGCSRFCKFCITKWRSRRPLTAKMA